MIYVAELSKMLVIVTARYRGRHEARQDHGERAAGLRHRGGRGGQGGQGSCGRAAQVKVTLCLRHVGHAHLDRAQWTKVRLFFF